MRMTTLLGQGKQIGREGEGNLAAPESKEDDEDVGEIEPLDIRKNNRRLTRPPQERLRVCTR